MDEFADSFEGMPAKRLFSLEEYNDFRRALVEHNLSFKTKIVARRRKPRQFLVILLG